MIKSTLFVLFTSPEGHSYRIADKSKLIPNLILEKTLIREMYVFRVITKEDKGRRRYIRLGGVIELEPFSWLAGRRVLGN